MRSRPNKRNKDLWCHFHNDHGHSTANCGSLKRAIEALIKRGQLRKFVAHKEGQQQTPPPWKKEKIGKRMQAGNFDVKHVLIDNRSSAEVIFYDAFKKMNISTDRLQKMDTPLYGFSNQPVAVEGIIALPVVIGTPPTQANFMLDFVVVKAVVSTYHLKMKFPMEHGIVEVKGDQAIAHQCYMASCLSKNKEAFFIEDLREDTKMQREKPVEDLISEDRSALSKPEDPPQLVISEVPDPWNLYVDGSSAIDSSGAEIILISPKGFVVEYALRFGFQASNNEAEYEALLAGIRPAHALKVDSLSVHSDSQLVVNHVLGDYKARDKRMAQYLQLVKTSASKFKNFTIRQTPRDQNFQVDTLSRLTSTKVTDARRSVYLEFLKDCSINSQTEIGMIDQVPCWMDMIIKYLSIGELPSERHEVRNLHVKAARYALVDGVLYKKSFSLPYLRCLRHQNPYMHCKKYMKGYAVNILEEGH
ncbi:hypothetical protein RJ639_039807 [Escallonia herrerae]|uniref:RNase H type-1 domain-containing protein n=1 Tax=Escallonia herrerae TaxID=1293975 RepID=A0AA88WJ75_9ASTE|nr:hypothetical protein RJ639_039807 [Escallonia herrerae]